MTNQQDYLNRSDSQGSVGHSADLRTRIAAVSDFDENSSSSLPPKSPQSDDLRTRIAAVLLTHQHVNGKCLCQGLRERSTSGEHSRHVADALIREMFTPEYQRLSGCWITRYNSAWRLHHER